MAHKNTDSALNTARFHSKYAAPPKIVIPIPVHQSTFKSIRCSRPNGASSPSRLMCCAFLFNGKVRRSSSPRLDLAFAVGDAVGVAVGFMVTVGSICGGL